MDRARAGGRGRLNIDRVLGAARELVDRRGLEGVTMRALAAELGVVPMALYKHVASKEELLDALVDLVFSEVEFEAVDGDWKTAMRLRAVSMRRALARHPWAIGMMEGRVGQGPASLRYHNAVMRCLREAGFSFRSAIHAYSVLDGYIYGFALQAKGAPLDTPELAAETVGRQVSLLPATFAQEYPYLAEVAIELGKGDFDYATEFEVGLDLILEGIERLRPEWRTAAL